MSVFLMDQGWFSSVGSIRFPPRRAALGLALISGVSIALIEIACYRYCWCANRLRRDAIFPRVSGTQSRRTAWATFTASAR
jgi:hypothetical protein